MILANDLLAIYLENELAELDKREPKQKAEGVQKSEILWTGPKTALIELLYALHSEPVINYGNAELQQIAIALEKAFNVELGQYHRTFLELRMRKGMRGLIIGILIAIMTDSYWYASSYFYSNLIVILLDIVGAGISVGILGLTISLVNKKMN
jgi:hypothetical protein